MLYFLCHLVLVLISLLMPEDMDAMVEASRVFGNFSRSKEVRTLLVKRKGKLLMVYTLLSKHCVINYKMMHNI